ILYKVVISQTMIVHRLLFEVRGYGRFESRALEHCSNALLLGSSLRALAQKSSLWAPKGIHPALCWPELR
ncbi:MAG TPA: hypothetical protein VN577_18445, partial [Terriglobales bacterium]|nr:hypothetical protein [Terriglobales bacterium]